jgi:hypothetical protein
VEGTGTFAVAIKLGVQAPDCAFTNVFPHAVIVPGVVESGKEAGTVLNITEEKVNARLLAIGEPQPVTGSQPVPAAYPLFPVVTS